MQAGKLRHRLLLLSPAPTTDRLGDTTPAYVPVATVWAQISPMSGHKLWIAKQVRPDVTHEILTRYNVPVNSRWQATFQGRTFNLGPPISLDERHKQLTFYAVELVS